MIKVDLKDVEYVLVKFDVGVFGIDELIGEVMFIYKLKVMLMVCINEDLFVLWWEVRKKMNYVLKCFSMDLFDFIVGGKCVCFIILLF